MPGYGFAKAPKAEVAAWTRLIRDYLRGRVGLRRLCLLIDARHGLKPVDREIMDLMEESAVVFQIVLTKCDKAKKLPQLIAATEKTVGEYRAGAPQVIATSSRQNLGIADLRAELAKLALDEALGKTTPEFPRSEETEKSDGRRNQETPGRLACPRRYSNGSAALYAPPRRQDGRGEIRRPCDGRQRPGRGLCPRHRADAPGRHQRHRGPWRRTADRRDARPRRCRERVCRWVAGHDGGSGRGRRDGFVGTGQQVDRRANHLGRRSPSVFPGRTAGLYASKSWRAPSAIRIRISKKSSTLALSASPSRSILISSKP